MTFTRFVRSVALLGLHCAVAHTCIAADNHVAWSKVEIGAWKMTPIYSVEGTSPPAVDNFLAIANTSSIGGQNLVAVWYNRQGGAWQAKSWETNNPWEAIESVKDALSLSSTEDERWDVAPSTSSTTPAPSASAYSSGLLSDDPLADFVLSSPDRDLLIEMLSASGYPAADIPIDKEDECTTDEKLDALAGEAIAMISSGDETVLTLSAAAPFCSAIAGNPRGPLGPAPVKPAKPTTAPAWTPPGTVPTTPSWTPGGWPTGPGWTCRTTPISMGEGTNCICTRRRQ